MLDDMQRLTCRPSRTLYETLAPGQKKIADDDFRNFSHVAPYAGLTACESAGRDVV